MSVAKDRIEDETPAFLRGGGETASLIASRDWSASLGPISDWRPSLRSAVGLMVRSAIPMVLLWGPDGVMLYNDAYAAIAAAQHPDLLGSKVREALPELAEFNDHVMKVGLAGGTLAYKDQELTVHRSGIPEQAWMNLDYSPVLNEAGQPAGVLAVVVETTERVLAERRQAALSLRLRRQFEQAPGFVIIMTGPTHIVEFVNETHRSMFGSSEAWIGKPIRTAFPSLKGQGFLEALNNVYATGEPAQYEAKEVRYRRGPDLPTELRYVSFVYAPLLDDDGKVAGIFCNGFDVTEARRSSLRREALVRLTDQLRDLDDVAEISSCAATILGETLDLCRAGYGVIDTDSVLHVDRDWAAPGVEHLTGDTPLDAYGDIVEDLKRHEVVAISDVRADIRTRERANILEARGIRALVNVPVVEHGQMVAMIYANASSPRDWDPEDIALLSEMAARTRTAVERARGQAELRASEANFRSLANAMPSHIWTASADGDIDWLSDQIYAYTGAVPGSLVDGGWEVTVHPDDLPGPLARWRLSIETGATFKAEFRIRRSDGAYRWHLIRAVAITDERGQVVRWVGVNADIQDQKEAADALANLNATLEQRVDERTRQLSLAQDALRQAQKMEAVGQLTGGIAHDFNNLLTGISGSLELMEKRLREGRLNGIERYIDAAQQASRRAASLTQRLLAFSRRQTLDPRATDVNRLVGGMEDLIRRSVGPDVAVEVVGAQELWTTRVDPGQLENALLNLCINGRDAMAPNGGHMIIETANVLLEEDPARERDLPPGPYILLSVTDTGVGMAPEVIGRAFDPFYTTKPLGIGTGLGLSMVYGFARQSGGQVSIVSEVGRGTTVCLYLPRFLGEAEAREPEPSFGMQAGDGEIVLVVDDETTVRQLVVEVLTDNGYTAMEASDGPSALRVLESEARIDLLITDVGLPGGMNGRQVADAARVSRPDLKVLFITGYAENAVMGNGHLEPGMAVVTKPFVIASLGAKIRGLIEHRA